MWRYYNPNPTGAKVGDCSVRAVCKAVGVDWDSAFASIALAGFVMGDMPSSNAVWGAFLRSKGFKREAMPEYSFRDPPSETETAIDYDSGTEFSETINGRDPARVWPVIDELMTAVQVFNPRLYAATIRKLNF